MYFIGVKNSSGNVVYLNTSHIISFTDLIPENFEHIDPEEMKDCNTFMILQNPTGTRDSYFLFCQDRPGEIFNKIKSTREQEARAQSWDLAKFLGQHLSKISKG